MTLISGRMTYSSFCLIAFPIGPLLGCFPKLLEARRLVHWRTFTYIMKSRLAVPFGGVIDRESKHLGKKASGI